jgi:O-antigen ligase
MMNSVFLRKFSQGSTLSLGWAVTALVLFGVLLIAIGSERADLAIVLSALPVLLLVTIVFLDRPQWPILLIVISYMIDIHFNFRGITSNIVLFGICFFSILIKKNRIIIVHDKLFLSALLAYVTIICISYYNAHKIIGYYEINLYVNNIIIMLLMFIFDSKKKVETLYKIILWSSVVLVALGLYQLVMHGMPKGGTTAHYANHVVYALHISWGVPLSLYFWTETKKRIYLCTFFFQILGISLAYSRGVILAVCVSLLLYFLIFKFHGSEHRTRLLMVGLLNLCAVAVIFSLTIAAPQLKRFSEENAFKVTSGRNVLYGAAWQIIKEHPIAGVGWDNYRQVWSDYVYLVRPKHGAYVGDQRLNPHSSYLKVMTELGLVGFVVFLIFNIIVFKYSLRAIKYPEARPILAMLVIYYVHGLFDNNSYGNDRMFYILSGLLFTIFYYMKTSEKSSDNKTITI